MGTYWRWSGSKVVIVAVLLACLCSAAMADQIEDQLDRARAACDTAVTKAAIDLTSAFDAQIKAVSQTGDLDEVEQLRAQRAAFVSSKAVPTATAMRQAAARYQHATASAEVALMAAYETAISDYTKAGRFDGAETVRHAIDQRSIPQTPAGNRNGPTTMPADPIMDNLNAARAQFAHAVRNAHGALLAAIDAKAKAAGDRGDLDAYKQLTALSAKVKAQTLVPADVTDADISAAGAKFTETARTAYDKLCLVFRSTISDLTKARRIDEAESVEAELAGGGWLQAYTGRPETIDLLKTIDVARDTIRKGWVIQNGVLQPTRWDDDHGPFIKIPVSVKGSYELHLGFRLAVATDALYVHVPVGNKWGLLVLTSATQDFANIPGRGELRGFVAFPLQSDASAVFRVSCAADGSAKLVLAINGQESFTWTGDGQLVVYNPSVWGLDDESCFAVDAKSAVITRMDLRSVLPDAVTPVSATGGNASPNPTGAPVILRLPSSRPAAPAPVAAISPPPGPTIADLEAAVTQAKQAVRHAPDICIRNFHQTDEYKRLQSVLGSAEVSFDEAKNSGDFNARARAASAVLNAKKACASGNLTPEYNPWNPRYGRQSRRCKRR
jgi:hypothetical protein